MLQKFEVHPYLYEIDLCDHLLKFCYKNMPKPEQTYEDDITMLTEAEKAEKEELRKKAISEALDKGKLMRAQTKEER